MAKFAGQLADALVAAAEANKPAILAALAAAEGGVEAGILNAIKNAPKPGGLLGAVFPIIEAEAVSEVQALVAQYGPEIAYDFAISELKRVALSFGG